jgi:D-glycero-D-manno-heptose 1,7-bisphosphate phosphatase
MGKRAVFIDRDGTLVHARHYPRRPEDLVLHDGVGRELTALRDNGFTIVVISNQSGIARGYFDAAALRAMHEHLARQLASEGAQLDAIYFCPHAPEDDCACRKPAPGMLLDASRDLDIDLARSWMVGDILDDVEAGRRVGCRTALVDRGTEKLPAPAERAPDVVARDTVTALRYIRQQELDRARG